MEFLRHLADFFLHLDKHLADVIRTYDTLTYGILFAIIFCETGLVVTPFLPGDSLLFAVGAFCAKPEFSGVMHIGFSYLLLTAAALLGDHSNYWIGRLFGPNVFGKFVNRRCLKRTHMS